MDIRKEFLEFFEKKQHNIYNSMPLVPDDPTLLFTNAGMVQFKDIFTGAVPIPPNPKAASCQLCLRAGGKHNDLENVGYTSRHHTLFEMLGNFSFGDYFKKEAIAYAWEFITEVIKLPKEKLYVTVHDSDDEAYILWQEHIEKDRIYKMGDADNFWAMGDTGACGPCSEIFYDQGSEHFNSEDDCMGGDGDRFLEIWNLVFMQYERDSKGELKPLPKPSIDTGMGLERITAIKEGVYNNYDSSIFEELIGAIEKLSPNKKSDKNIASFRVIADHIRAVGFLLAQGVLFDKEGRGYVLRRIARRAIRHGYLLGIKEPFMSKLVDPLCNTMAGHYEFLNEKKEFIKEQMFFEEERFFKTIASGMSIFEDELANSKEIFSGEVAFKLYDTYGFPLDLTQDMLKGKNLKVDILTFDKLMDEQKSASKASWKGSGDSSKEGDFKKLLEKYGKNNFVGYTNLSYEVEILALMDDDFNLVDTLDTGEKGWVMLDNTPFYAESGGQCGDIGVIERSSMVAFVEDTKKFFDMNLSRVSVKSSLKVGEKVYAVVANRSEIAKHHSATHLLHSALRMVLGEGVSQAGSSNDATRLRFDFTYPKALTKEQIDEVQDMVNSMIARAIPADIKELPIDEAKKLGAIAMFGEKYGDIVRVIDFGGVSIEFCGGTHVRNSADIGSFYITKESGVSAGVRRIEAVVGISATNYVRSIVETQNKLLDELRNPDLLGGVQKLKDQIKQLKVELSNALSQTKSKVQEEDINGIKVVVDIVDGGDIKAIIDDYKNGYDKVAIFLLQAKDDKVMLACGIKGIEANAGDWIKNIAPIVGGGGGGRADFAQAGGKDISKIEEAKKAAYEYILKLM
ncbi:MAG: alanine--tRNA ligase [Arcobacter butzleri]|jgi:alanyl-tRNA synthetase|nr:alanine--tRNA ligase [Arcobacteraceae bacterium]MDY0364225.1 alanine--tRNA ligase [Arcobacteraceae bacterium]NLO17280.1 alanine--tRNA ligase [Aliarcobacter butzleri]